MKEIEKAPVLRAQARKLLVNNWGHSVVLVLLSWILGGLVGAITDGIVSALVTSLISIGVSLTFYDLVLTKELDSGFMGLFAAFTDNRAVPMLVTWLLDWIWTLLWSLLLFVPGIVKSIAYSQAFYIVKDAVAEGRDLSATEAITKSRQMMNGHKWEYFYLQLTFIGWSLLACLTLGIGFLWLVPYMRTTDALFYQQLKELN